MKNRDWIGTITDDPLNEVARRAGIPQRTLYNQLDKKISAENVIRIAVTYGRHPLRALIDTGHIDEAWAHVPDIEASIRIATEDQLADEVLRRMKLGVDLGPLDEPIDEVARRHRKTPSHDGGTGSDRSTSADDAEAAARLVGATLAERRRIERSRERAQIEDRQRRSVEGE